MVNGIVTLQIKNLTEELLMFATNREVALIFLFSKK